MRYLYAIVMCCFLTALGHAQAPPPLTATEFRTLTTNLQKQFPLWEQTLQSVKVEELPIGYAQGSLIEKTRTATLRWLMIARVASRKVLDTDALSDQINLAYILNELGHSMNDTAEMLADVDLPKGPTATLKNQWMVSLGDLANGPINTASQQSLVFVMARADALQRRHNSN